MRRSTIFCSSSGSGCRKFRSCRSKSCRTEHVDSESTDCTLPEGTSLFQAKLAEDDRGRAEAGERRLQQIEAGERIEHIPVRTDIKAERQARQNNQAGKGQNSAIHVHCFSPCYPACETPRLARVQATIRCVSMTPELR